MADELKKKKKVDEGYTTWGAGTDRAPMSGSWFNPIGRMGKWFSRFFASKAQPYVATQKDPSIPTELHPMSGDTIQNANVIKGTGFEVTRGGRSIDLPELEINRRNRYKEFEFMDDYPEVGAAFDIYADDSTQMDNTHRRWIIKHDNELLVQEVNDLFDTIKLDRLYWDIIRNTVKYGDCFIENIINIEAPKEGIQRIKILNPKYILRVENEYGYLTDFLQEIPQKNEWENFGTQGELYNKREHIELDKNQIVHFRLHTSDPAYYPYGKSIASLAIRVFRALRLMEDAMLIYRLQRAPERRAFYIDVGNLPDTKISAFMEKIKQKFKKEQFYNTRTGEIDARYNPLSADEDFFIPVKASNPSTKIEVLPGAQNLGEVDDVKYFRDKLLAALKVPKDYLVEKDQSPERKANLSQLDVKFARVILRIQHTIEVGLETIAKRHLEIKGFPSQEIASLRIKLPAPSDLFEKRRLDIEEQKSRVIQAILGLGLFSKERIYKDFYDMSDTDIEQEKKKIKKDLKEMQEQGMQPGGQPAMMPGGDPMGEDPMAMGDPMAGGGPDPNEAGGQEPSENEQPTKEGILTSLYDTALINEDYKAAKTYKKLLNNKKLNRFLSLK